MPKYLNNQRDNYSNEGSEWPVVRSHGIRNADIASAVGTQSCTADSSDPRTGRMVTTGIRKYRNSHPGNYGQNVFLAPPYGIVTAEHRGWYGKGAFDIVGAFLMAVALSPIIAAIYASLLLAGGSPFFGHQRIGKGGKRFICYKFRTMVPNAAEVSEELFEAHPELHAEWLLSHKLRNDPRVTRFGAFLRRTSLDELPQLWNVLKGEMSLVGPRPIVDEEVIRYGRAIRHYLALKPGLTGLWQVTGRNDTDYIRRVALDRIYAMRSSIWLDSLIMFCTPFAVMRRHGAY